jgi:hypothetical protein
MAAPLVIGPEIASAAVGSAAGGGERAGRRRLRAARAAPQGPGGFAGLEHERRRGRRLFDEKRVLVEDEELAVEEFAHVDATAGVGAPTPPPRDLHPAGPEVDGVVAGHGACVAAAQGAREVARRRAPGREGRGRGLGEARDEVGEELRQERVAGLERGQAAQPQFAGQPIL